MKKVCEGGGLSGFKTDGTKVEWNFWHDLSKGKPKKLTLKMLNKMVKHMKERERI